MLASSSFPVAQELKDLFLSSFSGNLYKAFKIIIKDEELSLSCFEKISEAGDQDFESVVLPLLDDDVPCYVLYRLDSLRDYFWVLVIWCPSKADVMKKMLYTSSSDSLKEGFEPTFILRAFIEGTKENVLSEYGKFLDERQKRMEEQQ